jgi:hypothetical protein
MSWKKFDEQVARGPIHALGAFWKLAICVLVLIGITTCSIAVVSKPFSIVGGLADSENVKYNYEWFKTQHEAVLALDVQIEQARAAGDQFKKDAGPRDKWHREDREESSRLSTILLGLQNARASRAADYNARSRMINRAIFKGTDTPTEIPLRVE